MNEHEAVLQAVLAMIEAAFQYAKVTRLGVSTAKPARMEPGGLVVMRDGDAGDPEPMLGVRAYTYTRRISVEMAPYPSDDPAAALAILLAPFRTAIEADRFLGGLADWMEASPPVADENEVLGAAPFYWAEVGLFVTYTTTDPLG